MVKFKAKTKDVQLNVRAKLSFDEKINFAELDAFSRKLIKGFLRPKQIKKRVIEYTGPVGVPLSARLQKPINKNEYFMIVEQAINCVQKLIYHKFSIANVVWNINYAYINEATKELQLIYLPESSLSSPGGMYEFFEALSYLVKPEPAPDMEYALRFLYFIRSQNYFDPTEIEYFIQSEDPVAFNIIKKRSKTGSGYMTDKRKDYWAYHDAEKGAAANPMEEDEPTGSMDEDEATGLMDDDEDTTRIADDEETGLLGGDFYDGSGATDVLVENVTLRYPTLQRVSTNETVQINKAVFRVGKEKRSVDYCVSDNNAVSRSHADIITRGQRYYVMDLNSKNKTYINDQPLPVNQECEILDGDKLRLANEEFLFFL